MNLSRRRVQRLGMEAIVACSARGLDLQCWRRPVFVLLPACQRCDGSADIDDTFGGVRSAGDERVNERARLGQCSGPDGGMDGVCDQRRCSRGQCCMIAVQRRWGVSDAERIAVGLERRYWMIRAGMLGLSAVWPAAWLARIRAPRNNDKIPQATSQHGQDSSSGLLMDVYERSCSCSETTARHSGRGEARQPARAADESGSAKAIHSEKWELPSQVPRQGTVSGHRTAINLSHYAHRTTFEQHMPCCIHARLLQSRSNGTATNLGTQRS